MHSALLHEFIVALCITYFDRRNEKRRWCWAHLGDGQKLHPATSSPRFVEIRGASNRGARSLATRWKMSLRGRTDDDDRFCRRSLLLFLIFLWWPYLPSLYHFLSLVIPVLHIFPSLLFFFSPSSRFLAPSWV